MRILVTGDSMIKQLSKHLPDKLRANDVTIKSFPGERIKGLSRTISDLGIDGYDAIVVHIGTNDISMKDSIETCLEKFKVLFQQIRRFNACAKVVVSAIITRRPNQFACYGLPPFGAPVHIYNPKIDCINTELETYCKGKENFFFCKAEDTNWEEDLAKDGLHLNNAGSKRLAKLFSKTLLAIFEGSFSREMMPIKPRIVKFEAVSSSKIPVLDNGTPLPLVPYPTTSYADILFNERCLVTPTPKSKDLVSLFFSEKRKDALVHPVPALKSSGFIFSDTDFPTLESSNSVSPDSAGRLLSIFKGRPSSAKHMVPLSVDVSGTNALSSSNSVSADSAGPVLKVVTPVHRPVSTVAAPLLWSTNSSGAIQKALVPFTESRSQICPPVYQII